LLVLFTQVDSIINIMTVWQLNSWFCFICWS